MNEPELTQLEDAPEPDDEEQIEVSPGFAIDSEARANWFLRKVCALRARGDKMRDTKRAADAEIKAAKLRETNFLDRFGGEMGAWVTSHLDGKRKSLTLLEGKAGFRTIPARLEVVDEETCSDWFMMQPELRVVHIVPILCLTAVQAYFQETGVVPPGCAFIPEREVLTLK